MATTAFHGPLHCGAFRWWAGCDLPPWVWIVLLCLCECCSLCCWLLLRLLLLVVVVGSFWLLHMVVVVVVVISIRFEAGYSGTATTSVPMTHSISWASHELPLIINLTFVSDPSKLPSIIYIPLLTIIPHIAAQDEPLIIINL